MKKMKFQEKWKKFAMCIAVAAAVLTASKAIPAYAGDFTDAVTLPTNGTWSGKCELAEKTTDYYKFSVSTAGEADIKIMTYTPNLECTLYDANFNEIRRRNSYSGSETSPNTETIGWWLSQGTYYVSVSSRFEKSGNYKLYLSFTSSGITAADKDSYDSPQNMPMNGKVKGVFTYSNQEDWYKMKISSAGKYKYICQRSSKSRTTCHLYDKNLTELDTVKFHSSDTETKEVELKSGTYYIKIAGNEVGGTYTCQFNDVIPVKGDILADSKNQAQYKVTKAGRKGGTVTYQKSTNGAKTSITIPATVKIDGITYKVTGIASSALKGNSRVKKVTIGKNVSSIGANAFSKCTSLKSITIPSNVKSIGKQAFYNCKNLKTITIKTKKLTSSKVGTNAFKGIYKKATIKVPKSKFSAYKKMLKKKGVSTKAVYKKLS